MNPWMRARGIYSFAQHPFIKAQRRNSRRSKCQHQSCSLSCRPWNLIMDCFYPCTKGETAAMCWKMRAVYPWTTVRVKQAAPRLLHCFFLTGQTWPPRVCLLVRGSCCMTQAVWALDNLHSVLGLQVRTKQTFHPVLTCFFFFNLIYWRNCYKQCWWIPVYVFLFMCLWYT